MSRRRCEQCRRDYVLVKGFILCGDEPYAVYFAACHAHDGEREAWLDIILGTFGTGAMDDHVTFGVRVGPVEGQDEPAATMVQGAIPYGDSPLFGRKLSRAEGLAHERLPECWAVTDFILVEDPTVHAHVYGP